MSFRFWLPLALAVVVSAAGAAPMHPGQDRLVLIHPESGLAHGAVLVPQLTVAAAAEPDPAEALGLPTGSAVPMHATEVVQALAPPGHLDDRFGLARTEEPTVRGVGPGRIHPGTPCKFLRCLSQVGEIPVEEQVATFADASRALTVRAAAMHDGEQEPSRGRPNDRLSLAFLPELHEVALIGFVLLVLAGLAKRRA